MQYRPTRRNHSAYKTHTSDIIKISWIFERKLKAGWWANGSRGTESLDCKGLGSFFRGLVLREPIEITLKCAISRGVVSRLRRQSFVIDRMAAGSTTGGGRERRGGEGNGGNVRGENSRLYYLSVRGIHSLVSYAWNSGEQPIHATQHRWGRRGIGRRVGERPTQPSGQAAKARGNARRQRIQRNKRSNKRGKHEDEKKPPIETPEKWHWTQSLSAFSSDDLTAFSN